LFGPAGIIKHLGEAGLELDDEVMLV